MFLFGHLGIGSSLVRPFSKGLSINAVLLGTLLPDLIDKPLYYSLNFHSGREGADLGLISGTRTFGHTALFLLILSLIAFGRKSRLLAAVALGVASHLVLDAWTDIFTSHRSLGSLENRPSELFWPFTGWLFPISPYHGLQDHLSRWADPFILKTELVGALLLWVVVLRHRKSRRV